MQLTIDIGYDQVFQLVRQLPPKEKTHLHEKVFSTATSNVPEPERPETGKGMIEKNRQEALRLALGFPVATQEDIDYQNECRRQFPWRTV